MTSELNSLYTQLSRVIETSARLQALHIDNPNLIHVLTSPGFPPPETNQQAVHQQATDFLLLTHTLNRVHQQLLEARKDLIMIGIHNLGQEKE